MAGGMLETPAQIQARANQMAQQQTMYQRQLVLSDYNMQQQQAMRQMQAFSAAGRAAAAMNAGLIGQVVGQYQAGADALANMGAAGAAMMSGAGQADVGKANAALGNVGAGQVAVGGPAGSLSLAGPAQAGVEQYYGATLPGQGLVNAAGYARAGAAGEIGAQNLRATQEAQSSYMQSMYGLNQQRAQSMNQILAQQPMNAQQYLFQLQDAQRQGIALASSLMGQQQQLQAGAVAIQGAKLQNIAAVGQMGQIDPERSMTVGHAVDVLGRPILGSDGKPVPLSNLPEMRQMMLQAKIMGINMGRVDYSASRAWGYIVDRKGQPILDKKGQPIPIAAYRMGRPGSAAGGLSAAQVAKIMPKAQTSAETGYYGYGVDPKTGKRVPATQLGSFDPQNSSTWGTGGLSYSQNMQQLANAGVPTGAIPGILNQYYARGDRGRPIFSSTEQSTLTSHYGPAHYKWFVDTINNALQQGDTASATRWINLALSGQNPGWATLKQ